MSRIGIQIRRVQTDAQHRDPDRLLTPASLQQQLATPGPQVRKTVSIGICVATYRRPHGLRRLLASIAAMEEVSDASVFVVVVDNDPGQAAGRAAVAAVREEGFPYPIMYEVEPERCIARARNRGVRLAQRFNPDWVAFVDDDEVVTPRWLGALREVAQAYGADVVSGAVRASCPDGTPRWLQRPKFFGEHQTETGTVMDLAYTHNVLVAFRLLADAAGPFDTRFGLSGGSDSHLFMRLSRGGARIVASGDALTYEQIPATRARVGWVLRRAFRVGNTATLCERALSNRRRLAERVAKAAARLGLGVAMLPLGLVAGRGVALEAAWNVLYGAGAFAGLFGYRYTEYSRVHGE
jgi:succinoglycan biosynthesis protein ExoM